ncbi:hypothetical protein D0T25_12850 [Duganella sp. BJB488]|nr:hypothetical protein D0T26_15595 [Duganella sp. BJB489]RFP22148.1 hypothetical protein D0T25_12850 [Duganella sp. BJB488]RFP37483.1 hypothetical protein D0T24_05695 [Duganella sp. BJB480]
MPIPAIFTFRAKAAGTLYRYLIISGALIAMGTLGGCSITRVSMATYKKEYAQLNPMGMDQAAAVRKIEAAGYSCDKPYADRTLMDNGIAVPVTAQSCSNASFELLCPQRRFIDFKFRTSDNIIIEVHKPNMVERSCF